MILNKTGLFLSAWCLAFGLSVLPVRAQETAGVRSAADEAAIQDTVVLKKERKNPFKWIGNYLKNANKEKDKPFDFSLLLGPSYTASTSLGLGVAASGLYSLDRSDSTLQKSNVSLYGNASIAGMLSVGVRGNNFFRGDRFLSLIHI